MVVDFDSFYTVLDGTAIVTAAMVTPIFLFHDRRFGGCDAKG